MNAEKRIVITRPLNIGGVAITSEVEISAFGNDHGLYLSASPLAISISAGSGTYRYSLLKEKEE